MNQVKSSHWLSPSYINSFACTMKDCKENCCKISWNIYVDKSTYRKYQQVPSTHPLKSNLTHYIKRNRSAVNDIGYAKFNKEDSALCPFLTAENLCSIQLGLGADYICNTCHLYPRFDYKINEITFRGLSLSCEAVCALALFIRDGIDFIEYTPTEGERVNPIFTYDLSSKEYAFSHNKHFFKLQDFIITILQSRTLRISERMIVLGMFMNKIDSVPPAEIPSLITSYSDMLSSGFLSAELAQIPSRPDVQLKLVGLIAFLSEAIIQKHTQIQRLVKISNQGFGLDPESIAPPVTAQYMNAYENYYLPYMKENEYILENFLVSTVFNNAFPIFSSTEGNFTEYKKLAIYYAILRYYLIGISASKEGLSKEIIIFAVSSLARAFDRMHSSDYNAVYLKIFSKFKQDTMPWFTALLKDS